MRNGTTTTLGMEGRLKILSESEDREGKGQQTRWGRRKGNLYSSESEVKEVRSQIKYSYVAIL